MLSKRFAVAPLAAATLMTLVGCGTRTATAPQHVNGAADASTIPGTSVVLDTAGVTISVLASAPSGVRLVPRESAASAALSREVHGSVVTGEWLATVTDRQGHSCTCWVVAVDPAGGLPADGTGTTTSNFDIHVIDGPTGYAYQRYYGYDSSQPAFSPIAAPTL